MKNLIKALLFLSFVNPIYATAQDSQFNYNSLQAGYSSGTIKVNGASINTSGTTFAGTFATSKNTFITGSVGTGTLNEGGVSVDLNNSSFGFGVNSSLSEKTDLVGSLSAVSSTLSLNGSWITSTGYSFDGAIRHALSDKVELVAGAGLSITGSDQLRTTSTYLGPRFKVSKEFTLGFNYGNSSNTYATSSGFGGFVRLDF